MWQKSNGKEEAEILQNQFTAYLVQAFGWRRNEYIRQLLRQHQVEELVEALPPGMEYNIVESITQANGGIYTYEYDTVQRLERGSQHRWATGKRFTDSAGDDILEATDSMGCTSRYAYDVGSRLVSYTDKLGQMEGYGYDAHNNITIVPASDGFKTQFTYDRLDQLTKVTDPMGCETRYTYDVIGNLATVLNAFDRIRQRCKPAIHAGAHGGNQ